MKNYVEAGVNFFRVYNDPFDIDDVYRKIIPYISEKTPDNIQDLVYLKESCFKDLKLF